MMHKDVLPCVLRDKAKPFFIIEPLYFTTGHNFSSVIETRGTEIKKHNCTSVVLGYFWSRIRLNYEGDNKAR
jgi:hypothetical protein